MNEYLTTYLSGECKESMGTVNEIPQCHSSYQIFNDLESKSRIPIMTKVDQQQKISISIGGQVDPSLLTLNSRVCFLKGDLDVLLYLNLPPSLMTVSLFKTVYYSCLCDGSDTRHFAYCFRKKMFHPYSYLDFCLLCSELLNQTFNQHLTLLKQH